MKKHFLKIILIVLGLLLILLVFLPKNPYLKEEALFRVESGWGSRDIAMALQREGFVSWSSIFRIYVLTVGVSGRLQAGDYYLSPSMNIPKIAGKLASGNIAKEKITIIEGWNLKDIGFYFENKGMFQAEELYDEMSDLEGYLFPDTYWVKKRASLEEITGIMRYNFAKKTEGLNVTPEIVIMASILEREVKTKEDKELVSGVLWKRLSISMPLQVDAELWTYDNLGLPSRPISNPGLESILAALNPVESPYLYYISTPEGETVFSRTLAEHNSAIEKYLK